MLQSTKTMKYEKFEFYGVIVFKIQYRILLKLKSDDCHTVLYHKQVGEVKYVI